MATLFPVLLFVIFAACVAFLYGEGLWSNAIRLINVVTAALVATTFWEPVATWLDGWNGSLTYVWDFLALWGLFCVAMIILRSITDFASRVKVRFLKIADRIGSALLSCWIGWVMVCFITFTLHTAPLARNFMGGGFRPEQRMFLGMAPDRQWLGFVQSVSQGAFSRSDARVFDPRSEFLPKYATRRANLEAHNNRTNSIRVRQ